MSHPSDGVEDAPLQDLDPEVTKYFLSLLEREGEGFIKKDQKFDIYAFIQD